MSFKGKYVAYYRVSTKKNQDLESQKHLLSMFLGEGYICKEFFEFESGSKMSTNKQLREAIDYCKANNKFLAVAEVDRLGRDAEYGLAVHRELDGRIFACNIPTEIGAKMDRLFYTFFMAFAEREREIIVARIQRGFDSKKAQGVKFGGYRRLSKKGERIRKIRKTRTYILKKQNDPKYHRVKDFVINRMKDFENRIGKKAPRTTTSKNGYIYQDIADELNNLKFEMPESSLLTEFTSHYISRLYYDETETLEFKFPDHWRDC